METTLVNTQTKWSVDQAHCEIGFKVRHLMITHVKGTFKTSMPVSIQIQTILQLQKLIFG